MVSPTGRAGTVLELSSRLEWGLIPAVPVPFRGTALAADAQRALADWMTGQQVAGVAVWAHTGRGPHLSPAQRHAVLAAWRAALPESILIAGPNSVAMAPQARSGGAHRRLRFSPRRRAQ